MLVMYRNGERRIFKTPGEDMVSISPIVSKELEKKMTITKTTDCVFFTEGIYAMCIPKEDIIDERMDKVKIMLESFKRAIKEEIEVTTNKRGKK